MSTLNQFLDAATAASASVHVVNRTEVTDTLKEIIIRPAVGAPLLVDGVSLPNDVKIEPDREELRSANTGITAAPLGIGSMGSIVITSDENSTGPISLFPERQVAVIERENIVEDIELAFSHLAEQYRMNGNDTVLVTGPSSTGDMGALVTGVHGPEELHVVVIDSE